MEAESYAFAAAVLGAHSAGAPHIRQRLYFCSIPMHAQRGPLNEYGEDGCDRQDTGRKEARGLTGTRGEVCNGNDAPSEGRESQLLLCGGTGEGEEPRGRSNSLALNAALASISTPSARDWKDSSGMSESGVDPDGSIRSRLDQLPRQAQLAASGLTAIGGTDATESTDQLDPEYSRWLMGCRQSGQVARLRRCNL